MKINGFERSEADPCLFYAWRNEGLVIWVTWVDDNMVIAPPNIVDREKDMMKNHFECDDLGNMTEYIGCKIERSNTSRAIKITQPVLVQSLKDEFDLPDGVPPTTPAKPGTTITKQPEEEPLNAEKHTNYRAGIGKLQHLVRNSRPDIGNAVCELSRQLVRPTNSHYQAMLTTMKYVVSTPNRGIVLNPTGTWNGKDKDFVWIIKGRCDSNYATNPDDRKSVSRLLWPRALHKK